MLAYRTKLNNWICCLANTSDVKIDNRNEEQADQDLKKKRLAIQKAIQHRKR